MAKRLKIGLALGSGGAKGLSHIGIIKTLEKHGIPIDAIAGTSIGAVIGAYYAAHKDSKKLEEVAVTFYKKKGFALFDPTMQGGLIRGQKIEVLLSEMLKDVSFDSLKIPFTAVATDVNTAEPVIIKSGDLVKALRASISVPGFFQPVWQEKKLLADGGLSNPVPVEIVRSMGADIVIGVNLDTVYIDKPFTKLPSLATIPLHSVNILRHHLALHSAKTADIVITPKTLQVGLIGWKYFFDRRKAEELIAFGEEAAEMHIPAIIALQMEKSPDTPFIRRIVGRIMNRFYKANSL
jgi:NTE family protein